jgi:DNA (cytosine-5)-methyltransferase 1
MLSQSDVDSILISIPELNSSENARAIITHILHNPNLNYPDCPLTLKEEILKIAKKKGITVSDPVNGFTFIDLFAGIGGFRQAFSSLGCQCVFSSEWDADAKKTYFANYGEMPFGDIRQIDASEIPDHDILCGGFPCQPFSIAGISKKKSLGRATGFEDKTQGTLFFDVARILKAKHPKAFFLENVKNLLSHDKGRTWKIIYQTLSKELKYNVFSCIVDGRYWVPQHRERIFIVGFDNSVLPDGSTFEIPQRPAASFTYPYLSQIIQTNVPAKFTLGPKTWECLKRRKIEQHAKGNGFGYTLLPEVIQDDTITSTISARYYKDGAEILIPQDGKRPRRLTVDEAMQLQGYDPKSFVFPVGDNKAYKQIGNSVVVPAVRETAQAILNVLER